MWTSTTPASRARSSSRCTLGRDRPNSSAISPWVRRSTYERCAMRASSSCSSQLSSSAIKVSPLMIIRSGMNRCSRYHAGRLVMASTRGRDPLPSNRLQILDRHAKIVRTYGHGAIGRWPELGLAGGIYVSDDREKDASSPAEACAERSGGCPRALLEANDWWGLVGDGDGDSIAYCGNGMGPEFGEHGGCQGEDGCRCETDGRENDSRTNR